jgi:hypothetical protein
MMKTAIKYGAIIAAVIFIINSILIDFIGLQNQFVRMYSGYVPFVLFGLGLFWAMRKVKHQHYHNDLNYGQAIYSGIVLSAFIGLFMGILNFIYFQFLNPGYAEEILKIALPLMEADKIPVEEIEKEKEIIYETYKPINQLTATFVVLMIIGVAYSAVFSAFLRTKDTFTQIVQGKPQTETEEEK